MKAAKGFLKLVFFMVYTFSVFFVSRWYILGGMAFFNIVLMAAFRAAPLKALKNILAMLPFVAFAAVINLLLGDLAEMLLVAARLLLVCNATFIYRSISGSMELARAVETLFWPVRLFRGDPKDIGLMVSIAVAFIPVLRREFSVIVRALRAKGMELSLKTMRYALVPFVAGILRRSGEIALALKARGYDDSETH